MSLRREIHSAFDVITPPLGGMPERVVETVLADKRRRRKEGIMFRVRAPLSLAAVFIVVALIAAALIGGRVIADWAGFNATPAGQPHSQAPADRPAGGPVPLPLQGDWIMLASESKVFAGPACPDPLSVQTCLFKLTFTASTYYIDTNIPGFSGGGGQVVANGQELDFYNGHQCVERYPKGVGRYTYSLSAQGVLSFTSLNVDDCPRGPWLQDQVYTRSGT